jgi:hypothetical protein
MLLGVDDLMPIGEFSERSGLTPKRLRSDAGTTRRGSCERRT